MKALIIFITITSFTIFVLFSAFSCVSIPKNLTAIQNFEVQKYTGTWYEIARFDFRFEKNLKNVTATYSQNPDGSIKVVNKGFDYIENKWKQAEGKAKFVNDVNEARLKVSFFGPFYAGYNVIAMQPDYKNVWVVGNDKSYMWILSRNKTIDESTKNHFIKLAKEAGFNTDKLIWTIQE